MTPEAMRAARVSLGVTQTEFANLLGVHALTVSKWERGLLRPTPYQEALIASFRRAADRKPDIGEVVAAALVGAGVGVALYYLLSAAFDDQKKR